MTPERRQLRRLRWRGTVLFAVTTALCLVVLAVMASVIDSRSHTRETYRELGVLAAQLARSAASSGPDVRFGPQDLETWTSVNQTFAYVDQDGILVASPSQGALPASGTTRRLMARALHQPRPVTATAPALDDGTAFDWVFRTVPYSGTVVVVGAPATPPPAHRQLDLFLLLSVIGLCTLGTGLGHVLSGLAMRPAIRSIEQHEQFLREAAHELRTPLAVMRLALEEGKTAQHQSVMSAQVSRMSTLVSGLLDRARIRGADPSSFALEPVRLDQVVEIAVEDIEGAGDIVLDLEQSVVRGNPDLLDRAVRNLVENAVRHGATPICVRLHRGVLEVSDGGVGIDPRRRRAVLRGGHTTAVGTGTGTGLAIVSWVAKVHRADLLVRNADPHGLRVTMTFPQHARRQTRAAASP